MYFQKVISNKNFFKKFSFLLASLKKMTKIAGTGSGSDPFVRGTDQRIRIHTKMSCIRNTGFFIA
jgi:hypothetical protein